MKRQLMIHSWKKTIKRMSAYALTVAMVVSTMVTAVPEVAFAATELTPENIRDGASDATLYSWKSAGVFDLQGLKSATTTYPNGISTTYGNRGYQTWVASTNASGSSGATLLTMPQNGGVGNAEGVEVKIAVTPSKDNKYVLIDYYIYNPSASNVTRYIGTATDLYIGTDDRPKCIRSSKGVHMVSKDMEVYDLISQDSNQGLTPPSTVFLGNYSSALSNSLFVDSGSTIPGSDVDTGIAYSWTLNLRPYETAHRRVAFAVRSTSYYVSNSGTDVVGDIANRNGYGTYDRPYKTIGYAIERIKAMGGKGYIYIMDDNYPALNQTFTIDGNTDITIASTDYNQSGVPTTGNSNYVKTLKRSGSFLNGPLFNVSGNGILRFTDIIIDGADLNASHSLIAGNSGTVEINTGAILKNAKNSSQTTGAAVDITGTGKLSINYGTITNNNSTKKGAVNFSGGAGGFELRNIVTVSGNTDTAGKASNVYLGTGKAMTIKSDLETSSIGVSMEAIPNASIEGIINNVNQEPLVASLGTGLPTGTTIDLYTENFTADAPGAAGKGLQLSTGTASIGNSANLVMRRVGYAVSYVYKDAETGGTVVGAPAQADSYFDSADPVALSAPGSITGYQLQKVTIEQGSTSTLTANTTPGADFGKITGTMPAQDIVITYEYKRMEGSIAFVVNGGTPQPPTMTGAAGSSVSALLPQISRYGYTFKGWSTTNDRVNPNYITVLPSTYPNIPTTYYAIFEADSLIDFQYTVEYINQSGNLMFQTGTTRHVAEDALGSGQKNIHGYSWSKADSKLNPATFDYDGSGEGPTGTFGADGTFTGKMPNQDMTVSYVYKIDRANESAKSLLRVKYVSETGTVVQAPLEVGYFPEDAITATPVTKYGYQLTGGSVTAGKDAVITGSDLKTAVSGSFDSSWKYTGTMPNQVVEITYTYKATGEGYPYTVTYKDNNATDEKVKTIKEVVEEKKAEVPVTAEALSFYGYNLATQTATPAASGIFAADGTFTGKMPTDSLTVRYNYNRDTNLWKTLTYKAGVNGTLNNQGEVAADVTSGVAGTYQTSVLINDTSAAGQAGSYTLKTITDKKLTPNTVADKYYRFAGWFVDQNSDGILNGAEALLTDDHRFTAAATITACYEKDPDQWYDLKFAAGDHGSLNAGEATTLNVEFDKKWGEFTLPAVTPEVNYLFDRWYDGDKVMKAGDTIEKNHTYTAKFYPDPDIFGTEVTNPTTSTTVDDKGSGRVTVYQTNASYQYILTDSTGKIVAVKNGSSTGGTINFDGLAPGENYKVYEAERSAIAEVGSGIGTVTGGDLSAPTDVLTPVVDHNYRIENDKKDEGKAVIVISPADINTDYAVLDKNGNVVITSETSGEGWQTPKAPAPSQINFTGLDSNEEYTIVAKPKNATGVSPESKLDQGAGIIADPSGSIQMPKFILATINGRITKVGDQVLDTDRYEETHSKDKVTVKADERDVSGNPFLYWKITVGSVEGLDQIIKKQEVSFSMPSTNVVMTAYYDKPFTGNAAVTDEGRGTSGKEFALNPLDIPDLEASLTTPEDKILVNTNGADVTYKMVYRKGLVKATESNAIKVVEEGSEYEDHRSSHTDAWSLDVEMERYVNGRKVNVATSSNAEFTTYVHLNENDVDMLDYRLYRVETDEDGNTILDLVTLDASPDETGGLFTFTTKVGERYLLVYSKAYRVYFQNILETENFYYYFNVRKGEAPSDFIYDEWYQTFLDYDLGIPQTLIDKDGLSYSFDGWSYQQNRLNRYDEDRLITKETTVYAYYKDNKGELDQARNQLDGALLAALKMSDDYFLKPNESAAVKEAIAEAMAIFEKTNPRATAEELQEALDNLKNLCKPYEDILEERYENYDDIQNSGSSGGHGGGGGSGSGTKGDPFGPGVKNSYTVGTNGQWTMDPAAGGQWKFVLSGGIELKSQWAKLSYTGNEAQNSGWYHFDSNGILSVGWFRDEYGSWYYSRTQNDAQYGLMMTGWYQDTANSKWYYLDPVTGSMATGWKVIDGKWYYFSSQETLKSDGTTIKPGEGTNVRSIGSMYSGERTPDGFRINADGQWIE